MTAVICVHNLNQNNHVLLIGTKKKPLRFRDHQVWLCLKQCVDLDISVMTVKQTYTGLYDIDTPC